MAEVSFKTPLTDTYASFTLEECPQFSLDDDDDHDGQSGNRKKNKAEIEPLTERRQSTSQSMTKNFGQQRSNNNNRALVTWTQEVKRNIREAPRLTDEVELDGNSDSDDLDLLPPLQTSTSKTNERKRKLKRFLQCCSPYFYIQPPKCVIM